jgi:ankyrin repeat protein
MCAANQIQCLFAAIAAADLVQVHQLLDHGITPNCQNPAGQSALVAASIVGDEGIVAVLLLAGAEVNAVSVQTHSPEPTHYTTALSADATPAALMTDPEAQAFYAGLTEFFQAFETEAAHLNDLATALAPTGTTALLAAIAHGHLEVINLLLAAGATVNPTDWDAAVPLVQAVATGNLEMVQVLLTAGANPNQIDFTCETSPLGLAIAHQRLDLVQLLLKSGADPAIGNLCDSALGLAAASGQVEIAKLLLEHGVDWNESSGEENYTALMAASLGGHLEMVKLLIATGADVNAWSQGETPLLYAAQAGHQDVYDFLYPLVEEDIRRYTDRELQKGIQQRQREQCPDVEEFIYAAMMGNLKDVEAAIAHGIEVNAIGANGQTALMYAVNSGHIPMIRALLAAGADPTLQTTAGKTALMLAANNQEIARLLQQA